MTVALCGSSALTLLFEQRELSMHARVPLPEDLSITQDDLALTLSLYPSLTKRGPFDKEGHASVHLALPAQSKGRKPGKVIANNLVTCDAYYTSVLPRLREDSFVAFKDMFVASPEFCFLEKARSCSLTDLILLGYKLCGDYRPTSMRFKSGNMPLTSVSKIQQFLDQHPGVHGMKNARKALQFILNNSNSHMETRLTISLILPHRYGGFNLPAPRLNQAIPGTDRTGDLCWLEAGVVVEYDSEENHAEETQKDSDSIRRAQIELTTTNMIVITVRKSQVQNDKFLREVALLIARRLGCERRVRYASNRRERDKLLEELFHTFGSIDDGYLWDPHYPEYVCEDILGEIPQPEYPPVSCYMNDGYYSDKWALF